MSHQRWLLLGCSLLTLVPIALVTHPPSVDLPQHGAQVAIFQRLEGDPCHFERELERNLGSPYLLGYLVALAFGRVLPATVAVKATLALAVIAVPFAFAVFVRAIRGPGSWALLGIPIAYSFAVHWGFLVYAFAIPLGFLFLAALARYGERPTPARMLGMTLFAIVLLAAHGLLFAFCLGIALPFLWARRGRVGAALVAWLPMAAVAPVGWWWLRTAQGSHAEVGTVDWYTEAARLPELFSRVVGAPAGAFAVLVGLAVLALPWLGGAQPSRRALDWLPLYATVIWCLGAPGMFFGTAQVYGRYHVFLPALMLLAARQPSARPRPSPWPAAGLAVLWLTVLGAAWWRFERDNEGFRAVLEKAEPGRRAYGLVLAKLGSGFDDPVYLHFPVWYTAQGGCLVEPSFARAAPVIAPYRPGAGPDLPLYIEWWQDVARAGEVLATGRYDYLFVHDPASAPAVDDLELALVARHGAWSLWQGRPIDPAATATRAAP